MLTENLSSHTKRLRDLNENEIPCGFNCTDGNHLVVGNSIEFSQSFKQMIASCLVKEPSKRPSAKKLSEHSFFKKARSNDYIAKHLLKGLPSLGDRLEALKKKEEDMVAQKKIPDGEKEEISQNEYKRGISGWDFDIEDMKAQAAMMQDDDSVADKDDDTPIKQLQDQPSFARQCSFDASDDNAPTTVSSVNSTTNIVKYQKSNGDASVHASTSEQQTKTMFVINGKQPDNNYVANPASENRKSSGVHTSSNQSEKAQNHSQNMSHDGPLPSSDIVQPEIQNKGPKPSVNGNEVDEKAKNHVVQQKGRFKVTSENVEAEKVIPPLIIPKSHSMQVIAPAPSVSSPSPLDTAPSNPCSSSIFPTLQSILQMNIVQRDYILRVMKQASIGDFSGSLPMNPATMEKSALEVAHDKEKELLNEITDLQWRLILAQEELQKHKNDKARENNS